MTPVRIGVAVSASYTRYEGTASASVRMPVSGSWVVQEKTRVCPSSTCEGHPILGYPSPTFRCSPHPSSASVVPHAPWYVPSIKRNMGLCLRHQPSVVWPGSTFTVASIGESGSHHRHVLQVGVRMGLLQCSRNIRLTRIMRPGRIERADDVGEHVTGSHHTRSLIGGPRMAEIQYATVPLLSARAATRLMSHIEIDTETGCWNWTGELNHTGYGRFFCNGKKHRVHRLMYMLTIGPLPIGPNADELDHAVCKSHRCCNPWHLELVPHATNMLRARRKNCRSGHSTPMVTRPNGERVCVECESLRGARARAKMGRSILNTIQRRYRRGLSPERYAALLSRSAARRREQRARLRDLRKDLDPLGAFPPRHG
ncbi:MAG TPA: hypothetical protein DCS05_06445 [Nitrospiraceae bacterium]|nr:hypothetical protein [Nitrospiraceae bacterium]